MTDTVIIETLEKRRQLFLAEAAKLEQIMDVIRSSGNLLDTLGQPVGQEKSRKSSTKKAAEKTPAELPEKRLRPTNEFNAAGKLDDKIAYALTVKNGALKDEIIEVIMSQSPEQDLTKLRNALGVRLSYLLKKGYIAGRKRGRSYKYKLIQA